MLVNQIGGNHNPVGKNVVNKMIYKKDRGKIDKLCFFFRSVLKKEEDTEPARAHSPARPPQ